VLFTDPADAGVDPCVASMVRDWKVPALQDVSARDVSIEVNLWPAR
jgi:hypothetical protein